MGKKGTSPSAAFRRTALEHGAAEVVVVARRHGTICPKARMDLRVQGLDLT